MLPVDPTLSLGTGSVVFTGTVDGPQNLTINTSESVTFTGAVGGTTPLAFLTVSGGGPIAFQAGLVHTTGDQLYAGPVTADNLTLTADQGSITANHPGNRFSGELSATASSSN